jgi:hypothetical protein
MSKKYWLQIFSGNITAEGISFKQHVHVSELTDVKEVKKEFETMYPDYTVNKIQEGELPMSSWASLPKLVNEEKIVN